MTHAVQAVLNLLRPQSKRRELLELPKDQLVVIILEQAARLDHHAWQLAQLQAANTELRTTVTELQAIIASLRSVNAQLQVTNADLASQIETLTAHIAALQKDSSNSSKPPSSDLPGHGSKKSATATGTHAHHRNSRTQSGKKPGGQPGHQGTTRPLAPHPDTIIIYAPDTCGGCGRSLSGDAITDKIATRSQIVDIPPIQPTTTEYQVIARTCPCGHVTLGSAPADAGSNGTVQIGPNASSFLIYLNVVHHLPYDRLRRLALDLFQFPVSAGAIDTKLEAAAVAAAPIWQAIRRYLHDSPWVGSDETGVRVAGARWWQWVWQNTGASLYAISAHRDYQTVKDNFGEAYTGTIVSDCYSAQNNTVADGGHQQCHAHLLRDLQFLVDIDHSAWAHHCQQLLLRSQRAREYLWAEGFDPVQRERAIAGYEWQLHQLITTELPPDMVDAQRLQKRFAKHEAAILHFMHSQYVPPDNNGSERAIRNAKIKQKVSGGFRSARGAERHATLLSVIETAKKQGLNVMVIIQQLMRGQDVVLFGRGE